MSLVVNNNLMAANTARNLNAHYGRLATSTQRLSSGLRINSAADDAAGLAIRELQRADIAALQQGARNANDAISMIQVADGALGIIDEKLIRMKELAEQAATGTYDSTQRLMIESEYQAMASEITRIANATDFNGMKLLDGTLDGDHDGSGLTATGKMKIHFGTGNDSAEDYYYITVGECTAQAFGVGNASTWQDVQKRATDTFEKSLIKQIREDTTLSAAEKGALLAAVGQKEDDGTYTAGSALAYINDVMDAATNYQTAAEFWDATDPEGQVWVGNSDLMERYMAAASGASDDDATAAAGQKAYDTAYAASIATAADPENPTADEITAAEAAGNAAKDAITDDDIAAAKTELETTVAANLDTFWNGLRDTEKQKLQYAWGQAAVYNLKEGKADEIYGTTVPAEFPTAMIEKALNDVSDKVGKMDFAGYTVETQEDAQHALDAINAAIVEKDKIRAHLGATQNRLENTVSNLNIQAENLQAAESRISDVDVATEMTQFVRNQILTQSAVAMLGQANSLPQMAMQLIGG